MNAQNLSSNTEAHEMPAGCTQLNSFSMEMLPKWRVWQDSPTVASVRRMSDLPIIHIIVSPYMAFMSTDEFYQVGMRFGDLLSFAEREMGSILHEILPKLALADATWQCEAHVGNTESQLLPCVYILIGHRDLFESRGPIRHVTDTLIKPKILVAEARTEWRLALEMYKEND